MYSVVRIKPAAGKEMRGRICSSRRGVQRAAWSGRSLKKEIIVTTSLTKTQDGIPKKYSYGTKKRGQRERAGGTVGSPPGAAADGCSGGGFRVRRNGGGWGGGGGGGGGEKKRGVVGGGVIAKFSCEYALPSGKISTANAKTHAALER